jgi:hypothetical protein
MDDQFSPPLTSSPQSLEVLCSRYFLQWLHEQQISLAFTTYQTHRLFLIGLKPDTGRLSAFGRGPRQRQASEPLRRSRP